MKIFMIVLALSGATLLPGTQSTWTDGVDVWQGNPWCKEAGFLLLPDSPAIGYGDDGSDAGACSAVLGSMPEAPTTLGITP